MKPRFQADADLHPEIVASVLRRESLVDFQYAADVFPDGTRDDEVLRTAAAADRILVFHDVSTMPVHFAAFLAAGFASPGVILISQATGVGRAIEELLIIWAASDASEWRNLIVRFPL